MHTETLVKTPSADLLLKKLCRHFAHKVPATINGDRGIIEFPFGRCRLEADVGHLRMAIDLRDAEEAAKAEHVLGDHLQRMASKEALDVQWTRSAG